MKKTAMMALLLAVAAGPVVARRQAPGVQPSSTDIERRVGDLLAKMTIEEKVGLLSGDRTGFATSPIERLGIPSMTMTDGPVGVRWEQSTAFPAGVAMAASWDPDLVARVGAAIAQEAKAHGRDVLLGPCVNIQRVPQGGRNFESFGEDPYLAARMAVAYVRGVQGEGVVATVKHFAVNNQETQRMTVDARVDERTLHEIYLPAFKAAVQEAGAWAVMSAYNKLNGLWCSENPLLLADTLKRDWAFKGLLMSDWGAVHSTVPTANAACDLEMPRAKYMNQAQLLPAITRGEVTVATIDDKVRRILRVMIATGILDRKDVRTPEPVVDTPAHRAVAREAAIDSTVLLKNDARLLPLDATRVTSVAVIGPNAAVARTGGGGSSRVNPSYTVSPLEGIRARVGSAAQVVFAEGCGMRGDQVALDPALLSPPGGGRGVHGLFGEYYDNPDLQGFPVAERIDQRIEISVGREPTAQETGLLPQKIKPQSFSVRWAGALTVPKTGEYEFSARADDGVRLVIAGKLLIDGWTAMPRAGQQATIALEANRAYPIRIEYAQRNGGATLRLGMRPADSELLKEAVAAARGANVALVFAGLSASYESEGFDRETLTLPSNQEDLIQAIAAANPRTVVVLNSGAPIVMESWIDKVPALLQAWYPGSEAGSSAAALLFGDRSPSGKLPVTFLRRWEDSPAYGHFPGENGTVEYAEGVFVGYRHFDRADIVPRFAFGYGLTYTDFFYESPRIALRGDAVEVAFDVRNTGRRAGAEVAQIYVGKKPDGPARPMKERVGAELARPVKELKAFRKVTLKSGERTRVTLTLDRSAFATYDAARHDWVVEPGTYEVVVGSSSRLIRFRQTVEMK